MPHSFVTTTGTLNNIKHYLAVQYSTICRLYIREIILKPLSGGTVVRRPHSLFKPLSGGTVEPPHTGTGIQAAFLWMVGRTAVCQGCHFNAMSPCHAMIYIYAFWKGGECRLADRCDNAVW